MSRSCNFYLSALLASTFMSPAAAMDATLAFPENDFTLEYTHTNTPIPKPASLSNSYKKRPFVSWGTATVILILVLAKVMIMRL